MAFTHKLREEGLRLGMRAMGALMDNPDRAQKVMDTVQKVQAGKEQVDGATARLLHLADLPSREDFKEMGRRVGKLKRDARRLHAQLETISRRLEER